MWLCCDYKLVFSVSVIGNSVLLVIFWIVWFVISMWKLLKCLVSVVIIELMMNLVRLICSISLCLNWLEVWFSNGMVVM